MAPKKYEAFYLLSQGIEVGTENMEKLPFLDSYMYFCLGDGRKHLTNPSAKLKFAGVCSIFFFRDNYTNHPPPPIFANKTPPPPETRILPF